MLEPPNASPYYTALAVVAPTQQRVRDTEVTLRARLLGSFRVLLKLAVPVQAWEIKDGLQQTFVYAMDQQIRISVDICMSRPDRSVLSETG